MAAINVTTIHHLPNRFSKRKNPVTKVRCLSYQLRLFADDFIFAAQTYQLKDIPLVGFNHF